MKKTMSGETKLNIIAYVFIFLAIMFVTILIIYDRKIGGNTLNTKSYQTETSFYIADKAGNQIEVSEEVWKRVHNLEIVTIIFVIPGMISLAYLGFRYIGIPITKKNFQALFKFLEKWRSD